jgi:FHA domain
VELGQILLTAGVGLAASLITAVVTQALTRSQERRKYEREVAAKVAELKSTERKETKIVAVQYGHSCFIVEGPSHSERERIFLALGSRITMGSAPDSDIRLVDNRVSKMHATLRAQGAAAYAEPLGATQGLAVNGEVITKPRKLAVGDIITVPGVPYTITFVPLTNE